MGSAKDIRPALPQTPAQVAYVIRSFAQKYGRPPSPEELACLEYTRKLLAKKLANDPGADEARVRDGVPSPPDSEQAGRAREASG